MPLFLPDVSMFQATERRKLGSGGQQTRGLVIIKDGHSFFFSPSTF